MDAFREVRRRGALVTGFILCIAATAVDLRGQAPWPGPGIERAEGSRSHPILGAAVGFVLGAGTTYLVLNDGGSTSKCDRAANQDAMGSGACLGAYLLGGVIGAGLGAGVGALIHTRRWESLPLDGLGLAVLPDRRIGVRATLRW